MCITSYNSLIVRNCDFVHTGTGRSLLEDETDVPDIQDPEKFGKISGQSETRQSPTKKKYSILTFFCQSFLLKSAFKVIEMTQ